MQTFKLSPEKAAEVSIITQYGRRFGHPPPPGALQDGTAVRLAKQALETGIPVAEWMDEPEGTIPGSSIVLGDYDEPNDGGADNE